MGRVDAFALREPEPRDDEADALLADRDREAREEWAREDRSEASGDGSVKHLGGAW